MRGFFTRYQFNNRWFWWAVGVALGIMAVIIYVPFVARFFGTAPLAPLDWLYVGAAAAAFLIIREAGRILRSRGTAS